MVWSETLVTSFLSCILWSWPAASSFFNHMCVSVCVVVSSFSLHLLLLLWFVLKLVSPHSCLVFCVLVTSVASPVVWSESLVTPFLSRILWSWPAASFFFNYMCVSVCVLVSSFSLHLLLLLWFDLKLLSSHSCLVFCGAGLRPAPFLITCVSLSVYLSQASLYICCFSCGLIWNSCHLILVLYFVELACGQLLF